MREPDGKVNAPLFDTTPLLELEAVTVTLVAPDAAPEVVSTCQCAGGFSVVAMTTLPAAMVAVKPVLRVRVVVFGSEKLALVVLSAVPLVASAPPSAMSRPGSTL